MDKNKKILTRFQIGYKKIKKLDLSKMEEQYLEDTTVDYNPFKITKLQSYNPIYNRFFQMDNDNYNMITLNGRLLAHDLKTVYSENGKMEDKKIHIKFSPLLNPIHFLTGKYDLENEIYRTLPKFDSDTVKCYPKLIDVNNSSYTDAFFSYLSSMMNDTHGWTHGVEFFGSFLGIQKKFKFDIMDDFDFVNDTPYFLDNIGKKFELDENAKMLLNNYQGSGSRNNRIKINIMESDNVLLDVDNCELDVVVSDVLIRDVLTTEDLTEDILTEEFTIDEAVIEDPLIEENDTASTASSDTLSTTSSKTSSSDFSHTSTSVSENDNSEDDWETASTDNSEATEETDDKLFCYLYDFPVQLIFQEKCADTFDSLLLNHIPDDELSSALMQIVMMLITYQKAFDFTHNDLHTNNIMFIETTEPYLYYYFENTYYKVPTFGRIFKLIDFGRAIYRFNDKLFFSDSFSPNNDAHSQYNCEPYMNENKPRLDPNHSFDLARLGCSIYDFIFDGQIEDKSEKDISDVYKIIRDWCLDDNGKSVVYKRTGQERYPGFKLYKMIARTVHNHIPKEQLKRPIFAAYSVVFNEEFKNKTMNIDTIPKYMISEKK